MSSFSFSNCWMQLLNLPISCNNFWVTSSVCWGLVTFPWVVSNCPWSCSKRHLNPNTATRASKKLFVASEASFCKTSHEMLTCKTVRPYQLTWLIPLLSFKAILQLLDLEVKNGVVFAQLVMETSILVNKSLQYYRQRVLRSWGRWSNGSTGDTWLTSFSIHAHTDTDTHTRTSLQTQLERTANHTQLRQPYLIVNLWTWPAYI